MVFDNKVVSRVRSNIFRAAQDAISDWNNFPWHTGPKGDCDSDRVHSSQALAIDVFGTLQLSHQRDAILNQIASIFHLPAGSQWTIELEYFDKSNPLMERRLTQVDAVATSDTAIIFFECKFTETDGGSCRQPLPIAAGQNKGIVQCNGRYTLQRNPINGIESRCALSGKGIRYWEVIPQVFTYRNDQDLEPCPFRYSWYQWMRNLTSCFAIGKGKQRKPAFVIVYADSPKLPMAQKVKSTEWQAFTNRVRTEYIVFSTLSYQKLIAIAGEIEPCETAPWSQLEAWVEGKIQRACENQGAKNRSG